MEYSVRGLKGPKPKLVFRCPSCHAKMNGALQHAGEKISCPRCQASITIPGVDELSAWKKFRKNLREEQEAAKSDHESIQTEQEESVPTEYPETDTPKIKINRRDKILHLAFGFFKSISVLAICLTIAIIACTVIWVGWTWSGQPPNPSLEETFRGPDVASFAAHCEELRRIRQREERTSLDSDSRLFPPRKVGQIVRFTCNGYEQKIDLVIDKLFLDIMPKPVDKEVQDETRMNVRPKICRWLSSRVEEPSQAIDGLVDFAKAFNKDKKLQECLTPEDALVWYQNKWRASDQTVSNAIDRRVRLAEALKNRKIEALAIGGEIIGVSLAGLMIFIILPLLIQIERNTRNRLL